jgi:methionyl-tRNA formyltransferase
MVRAYAGWPGAWTTVDELRSSKLKVKSQKLKVGGRRVRILKAHLQENGVLQIDQLQIEGKKPIGWEEFARGYLR